MRVWFCILFWIGFLCGPDQEPGAQGDDLSLFAKMDFEDQLNFLKKRCGSFYTKKDNLEVQATLFTEAQESLSCINAHFSTLQRTKPSEKIKRFKIKREIILQYAGFLGLGTDLWKRKESCTPFIRKIWRYVPHMNVKFFPLIEAYQEDAVQVCHVRGNFKESSLIGLMPLVEPATEKTVEKKLAARLFIIKEIQNLYFFQFLIPDQRNVECCPGFIYHKNCTGVFEVLQEPALYFHSCVCDKIQETEEDEKKYLFESPFLSSCKKDKATENAAHLWYASGEDEGYKAAALPECFSCELKEPYCLPLNRSNLLMLEYTLIDELEQAAMGGARADVLLEEEISKKILGYLGETTESLRGQKEDIAHALQAEDSQLCLKTAPSRKKKERAAVKDTQAPPEKISVKEVLASLPDKQIAVRTVIKAFNTLVKSGDQKLSLSSSQRGSHVQLRAEGATHTTRGTLALPHGIKEHLPRYHVVKLFNKLFGEGSTPSTK